MSKKKIKVARSAKNDEFVTPQFAKRHPATTVFQRIFHFFMGPSAHSTPKAKKK